MFYIGLVASGIGGAAIGILLFFFDAALVVINLLIAAKRWENRQLALATFHLGVALFCGFGVYLAALAMP